MKMITNCDTCTVTGSKFALDTPNDQVVSIWGPKVFSTVYMYCSYIVLNYTTGAQIASSKFPYLHIISGIYYADLKVLVIGSSVFVCFVGQ